MHKTAKRFLIEHYGGIMAALLCGVIIFLPQWWLVSDAGSKYRGILMAEVDNDHYYLSRIAAAYRGDLKITEASIHGAADAPYTSPPLAENTVAALARLFGLSPAKMQFFGYFLFPFILGLILYILAFRITGSKLVAAITPLGIVMGSTIVMDFRQIDYWFFDPSRLWIIPYNRPIHPQLSAIYFFGWLALFYSCLGSPAKSKLVAAGVLLGLLFYVYPYSWTVALSLLGFYIFFSLVKKNFLQVKAILSILGLGLAISAGYWWNTWQLSQHPLFPLIKQHFVIYASRNFLWSSLLFLDFLGLAVFFWRKPKDERFYFFLLMFVSLFTVINQQVLTGVRMFPGHWHWYYIVPFSIFFWVYGVVSILRIRRLRQAVALLAVGCLVMFGYTAQRQYYLRFKDAVVSYQRFALVYEWLADNAPAGSVVVANDKFSERLPIYTSLYHYTWQGADELYLISNERIKHGFFVKLYLQGARENLGEHINASTPELQILLSGYFRRYANNCKACYTPQEIAELQQEYREFLQKDFYTELKRYKVDYAVWEPEGRFQTFDRFDFMEQAVEVGGLKIYKVN